MGSSLFRGKLAIGLLSTLGVVVLLQLITAGTTDPDGRSAPPGSSYSTNPEGQKAFRRLLEVNDYDVVITRTAFGESSPSPRSTIVILGGADLPSADQNALRDFVGSGGRLVIADQPLTIISGATVATAGTGARTVEPTLPLPALASVSEVVSPNGIVYSDPGPLLAVVGPAETPAVGLIRVGSGSVWALADPSVVSNDVLDQADNAALALALVGPPDRPVVFAEYNHGYEPITGLASLPGRWRAALWLAAIAGIVWMISRGRRIGPPEERLRRLAPPRSAYVAAMATTLGRTKDLIAATDPVRERIRQELGRRGGEDPADIARVARQLGLDDATVFRSLQPSTEREDALAAGRVLAKLTKNRL